MLFSSVPFLYYFLPAVLAVYFLSPKKLRNSVLLLASLFFYWWGEPRYVILMVATIALAYVLGLLLERFRGRRASKLLLWISLLLFFGALGYFKYVDFFISNINAATGLSVPLLRIALPIGISFYTFQVVSYVLDVYRGTVAAQRNPIHLAAYVAMFPQLIAGPIVRYSDIAAQLSQRTVSLEKAADGSSRFLIGLGKKVLLANTLGALVAGYAAAGEKSVLYTWLYAIAFTLQIYFDFSGYSDMAIGLGKIFGFDFMENFKYPYISRSITEFWRRWHISLGSWFRDYVYIPLGGNRVSKPRHLFNILVVWLLTGFWHGANWNFILWGFYFAVLLTVEKLWLSAPLGRAKGWGHIYVLFTVVIGFVIFNAADLADAGTTLGAMFGAQHLPFSTTETLYALRNYAGVLCFAAIGATPLPQKLARSLSATAAGRIVSAIARPVFLAGLLLLVTGYLVDGSFNPFLYFRF